MIPRFAILASALVPGLIALCSVPAWAQAEGPDRIVFLRDVYPILEDRCFKCHGEKKQKGDLRLDTRAGLFENEDTNAIPVVPGQPARSLVYKRITLPADHDERMPFSGNPLTSAQVQLIKTWIEQGAEWSQPQKAETGGPAEEDPLPREGEPSAGGDPGEASVVPKSIDFNRDVRPILSDKCFRCHGPDADQREARLRLDTKTGAFSALKGGGHAIVPGDSARSELVRRIAHGNPGERMPPPDSNLTLEPHERQILTRWIEGGAPWKEHWAFVAPKRAPLPPIGDRNWPRNAIDFFILARLEAEALTPSKPASRRTLIRRVTFDLTGLPPTPAEVRAFVADASPDAYEKVIQRLLASSSYGEHMARFWVDVARYGDTHGLHLDNYREMWPYRDWVIGAFNQNLSFDRFTVDQLAGDLIENASLEQRIASGFNRCHVTTNEGGSIKEEVYVRNVVDRVTTTGTAFLGMTFGCAVCHDHKFDPLTQKEFYQVFAFFNNLDGEPMDGNAKVHAPFVKIPTSEQKVRMSGLRDELAELEETVEVELAKITYAEPDEEQQSGDARVATIWVEDAMPKGAKAEGDDLLWIESPATHVYSGRRALQQKAHGCKKQFFANAWRKLRIGSGDKLFCFVFLDAADPPREIMLEYNSDGKSGWKHRAYWGEEGSLCAKEDTAEPHCLGPLPESGRWIKLEVECSAIGLRPGMLVHGMAFTQYEGTAYFDAAGIESSTPQKSEDFVWIDDDVPSGAVRKGDGKSWSWVGGNEHPVLSGLRSLRRSGGNGRNQDYFTGAQTLPISDGDKLFAHVWLDPEDTPRSIQLQFNDGTWEHRVRWGEEAHGAGLKGGANHVGGELPETGRWIRLEVDAADVGLEPGDRLNGWAFTQVGGTAHWDRAGIHTWNPPNDRHLSSQRYWEYQAFDDKSVPKNVREAVRLGADKRGAAHGKVVRDYYLRHIYSGTRQHFDALESRVVKVRKSMKTLDARIATSLVMKERREPRPAFLLKRGNYSAKGQHVERKTPSALPPMSKGEPLDRLGFARWLVSSDNPLTARVTVNRFWQQVFGTGIVSTSEDFGSQGEMPSHPKLLDWLATRFIDDGWDVKRMMKRIVMSATYRQHSAVTQEMLLKDPANRLLARGPRYRLDAEMLRDQALAVSGLLVHELGGPSVKPPQPTGLWAAVGYVGSNTEMFKPDKGPEKIYRRSLYTFVKRTAPPPQMSTFDAPSRETCQTRRERTNTPLQALLLMNDPQFVEAARNLAQKAILEGGNTDSERAGFIFLSCTSRPLKGDDLSDLLSLLKAERAAFREDPDSARKLLGVGDSPQDPKCDPIDLAAWTMLANLVLNLDEVITKG